MTFQVVDVEPGALQEYIVVDLGTLHHLNALAIHDEAHPSNSLTTSPSPMVVSTRAVAESGAPARRTRRRARAGIYHPSLAINSRYLSGGSKKTASPWKLRTRGSGESACT